MSWKPGKVHTRGGRRGRWWYYNGKKKGRRFQMKKPSGRPHSKRRR